MSNVYIKNEGDAVLNIISIIAPIGFECTQVTPMYIPPDGSALIEVTLTDFTIGVKTGDLEIITNDGVKTIPLKANVTEAPAIPDIVGMTQAVAEAAIVAAGYIVGDIDTEYSDTITVNLIIRQNPMPGMTVKLGEPVDFTLSLGPEPPEYGPVPDVVGLTQVAAESAIVAAGFTTGTITSETSETIILGNVTQQSPEAGIDCVFGEPISLVISAGPANINQLTYIEQTGQEISVSVEGLDADEFEIRKANGAVVTSPADYTGTSGTARLRVFDSADLTKLERVQLDVKGPTAPSKTAPSVAGLTESAANAAITAAGLTPDSDGAFSATVEKGLVISQSPAAGTALYAGDVVTITVSFGPERNTVPVTKDLLPAAAEAALVAAGLVLGTSTSEMTDDTEAGLVASSSPAAGTGVAAGSAVDLVVSLGDRHYEIPVECTPGAKTSITITAYPQNQYYWRLPDGSTKEGNALDYTSPAGEAPKICYFCARAGYNMTGVTGIGDNVFAYATQKIKLRDIYYCRLIVAYLAYAGLDGDLSELPSDFFSRVIMHLYFCAAGNLLISGDVSKISPVGLAQNANPLFYAPHRFYGALRFVAGALNSSITMAGTNQSAGGFSYADVAQTIINWDACNAASFARTGYFNKYKRSLIGAANPAAEAAIVSLSAKGASWTFLAE